MSDTNPEIGVDESRLERGAHGVMAESAAMNVRPVVIVGAISLVLFFLGGLMANYMLDQFLTEFAPEGISSPTALPAYEVGIVNQRSFDLDYHAEDKLALQAKTLNSYGISDPVTGKVHVPVSVAMGQVITDSKNRPQQPAVAPDAGSPSDAGTPATDGGAPGQQ